MKHTNNQKGNVLFLILIAVALFAALSYAVTQSSRSGGDSGRETNILNSAQLAQYPNAVRTAVLRMVIDGRTLTDLEFNGPRSFSGADNVSVFHPDGGGAVFQNAPTDIMASDGGNTNGSWVYNLEFEVPLIGISSATDTDGNDLIAFLPGVSQAVCERINTEAGIPGTPTMTNDPTTALGLNMDDSYDSDPDTEVIITSSGDDFDGQAFGCWQYGSSPTVYTYYHVINER